MAQLVPLCYNDQLNIVIAITIFFLLLYLLLNLSYIINIFIEKWTKKDFVETVNNKQNKRFSKYKLLDVLLPSTIVLFNYSLIIKVFINILGFNFYLAPIITMSSTGLILLIKNEFKQINTNKITLLVNSLTAGLICLTICWIIKTDLISSMISNNELIRQWLSIGLLSFVFASATISINPFGLTTELYASRASSLDGDSLFVNSNRESPARSSGRSNSGSVSESQNDSNEKPNSFLLAALLDIETRNKEIETVTKEIIATELIRNKMNLTDRFLQQLIKTSNITEHSNIDLEQAKIFSSENFPYTGEQLKAHFEQYVIEAMQGKHNNNQGVLFAAPANNNSTPMGTLIKHASYFKEGFYSRIQVYEFSKQISSQKQAYYAKLLEQSEILTKLNQKQYTIVEFVNMNTSSGKPFGKDVKTISQQISLETKFNN